MSTRAYRFIEVKHEETPTFNVSRQYELLSEIGADMDNEFFMRIDIEDLEGLLNNAKLIEKHGIDEDQLAMIRKDVEHAIDNGEDYVEYYIF